MTNDPDWTKELVSLLRNTTSSERLEQAISKIDLVEDIDPGIFDEIPFFSTFIAGLNSVRNLRTRHFLQKLVKFLITESEASWEDRMQFVAKMEEDEKFRRQVTEGLIILLDRYDLIDKAHLLGKLSIGLVENQIDVDTFFRIGSAIERAYIDDLRHLLRRYSELRYAVDPWERLHASGLAKLKVDVRKGRELGLIDEVVIKYEANSDAHELAQLVLGDQFQRWLR